LGTFGKSLDDEHATTAARTGAGQYARILGGRYLLIGFLHGRRNVQEHTCSGDVIGAIAVGEQPIVADTVEALGENVHQEAADELMGVEGHRLPAVGSIEAIVFAAECNAAVVGANEPAVGNGDAMGVAGHIA